MRGEGLQPGRVNEQIIEGDNADGTKKGGAIGPQERARQKAMGGAAEREGDCEPSATLMRFPLPRVPRDGKRDGFGPPRGGKRSGTGQRFGKEACFFWACMHDWEGCMGGGRLRRMGIACMV